MLTSIREGSGHLDAANDLLALADMYERLRGRDQGRLEELPRFADVKLARELADKVIAALGGPSTPDAKQWRNYQARVFTLLDRHHQEAVRVGRFLWHYEGGRRAVPDHVLRGALAPVPQGEPGGRACPACARRRPAGLRPLPDGGPRGERELRQASPRLQGLVRESVQTAHSEAQIGAPGDDNDFQHLGAVTAPASFRAMARFRPRWHPDCCSRSSCCTPDFPSLGEGSTERSTCRTSRRSSSSGRRFSRSPRAAPSRTAPGDPGVRAAGGWGANTGWWRPTTSACTVSTGSIRSSRCCRRSTRCRPRSSTRRRSACHRSWKEAISI
jgi:hypothetical protein